jgi:murein DD-endopeptidase MepM/ murein hydrolase activator NlpD
MRYQYPPPAPPYQAEAPPHGDEYDPYTSLASATVTWEWQYDPPFAPQEPEEVWHAWDNRQNGHHYQYEYEWDEPAPEAVTYPPATAQPDVILLGGVALVLLLLGLNLLRWLAPATPAPYQPSATAVSAPLTYDPTILTFPYDNYILTQGPHGYSYGHMAIDISAGNGATIKSPIFGAVTQFYFDGLGNSTLVIENEKYQIMMLHGAYTVAVGDQLRPGDSVGTESNIGNTYDWAGNSCRGRDCGYHTHLNIFDKELGRNVNPLELFYEP